MTRSYVALWALAALLLPASPGRALDVLEGLAPADFRAEGATPGTLLGLSGDALRVACGDGVLEVLELQRAGRKAVSARDFVNGLPEGKAVFQ